MSEPRPDLDKRVIRLPDGRRLWFYRFPDRAGPEVAPAGPEPAPPAVPPPPAEER